MPKSNVLTSKEFETKSEYTVEFECHSKILLAFEDHKGLTAKEIIARGKAMALQTFSQDGILVTERIAKNHSYAISVMGVDTTTANILSHSYTDTPQLKLIKN